jgi:hypothetical protein
MSTAEKSSFIFPASILPTSRRVEIISMSIPVALKALSMQVSSALRKRLHFSHFQVAKDGE